MELSKLSDVARTSAKNSLFLFLGKTSSSFILALSSIIIARLLGPENYGLYSIALIAPSFLVALSDLGISPALTRFSAQLRARGEGCKAAHLIKTGITFKLIFSIVLSLVLLLFSETIATHVFKRPDISVLICIASLCLVGQAILETVNFVFLGVDKTEISALLMNVHALTKTVTSILLIILGMSVAGATLGDGLGLLIAAGIGVSIILLRTCSDLHNRSKGDNVDFLQGLRLMVLYGIPLYLSTFISTLIIQYRSFILAFFVSNLEFGNYAIAMNFTLLITALSYPVATSLLPAFSKLSIKQDRESVEKMFRLSVKYTSLLIIPASVALVILSKDVVHILYGPQYQLASSYLAFYALSFLYAGLGNLVIVNLFNGQGDTKSTFRIELVSLSLSLPLAPILILFYDVPGLIASILISALLSTIYALFLALRKYKVSLDWISSLRIGAASLSSAVSVYLFLVFIPHSNPVYKLAAGVLFYVISFLLFAPLTGAVMIEDIVNLREIISDLGPLTPLFNVPLDLMQKMLKVFR